VWVRTHKYIVSQRAIFHIPFWNISSDKLWNIK